MKQDAACLWRGVILSLLQMVTAHPDFDRLADACIAIENDAAQPFAGIGFRFASLKYAKSTDLLNGLGAKASGGRINAKGTFPVIYTSTDPLTATAETFQNFASFGFDTKKLKPRILVGIELKISVVLDLCDRDIRRRLKVTLADLAEAWWPVQESGCEALTQAIGRAAHDAGFEAVKLPSARRKPGVNVNVIRGNIRKGSVVRVLAENELKAYLK